MVNSPSRPNSRPPVPVECGGMTPLWNWETCLPVDRPAMPLLHLAPPGVGTARPHLFPPNPNSGNRHPARSNQGRIKAKTPAIVPHQGISRQPMKKLNATIPSANGAAPYQPRATPWERANRLSPALKGRPIPPIKAKTPVIVHDQGKSRQTPKSQIPVCLANPPAGWGGRAAERSNHAPRRNPLPGGEETGEGERPTKLSGRVIMPAAANQGKNPSNQG